MKVKIIIHLHILVFNMHVSSLINSFNMFLLLSFYKRQNCFKFSANSTLNAVAVSMVSCEDITKLEYLLRLFK